MKRLSALIEEFPKAASLHGYVALFLSRAGRFDEAIEHGPQAIQLSPMSEKASFVHFDALWKAGQHIEVLGRNEAVLALKPSEEYTKMIMVWNLSESEPHTS